MGSPAQVASGGDAYFEWPTTCQGWALPELAEFKRQVLASGRSIYTCRVDGCAYGLQNQARTKFLRKRWTIWTTDRAMRDGLSRVCPGSHSHEVIMGKETARSAFYPSAMAARIAKIWATNP